MSAETFNSAVLLPYRHNWQQPPTGGREWTTTVADGVTSAEDRAGVVASPKYFQRFRWLIWDDYERHQAISRIMAGLKLGAVAVPDHGRVYETSAAVSGTSTSVGGSRTWASGEWVLLRHPWAPCVNRSLQINCGGAATGTWVADDFYSAGDPLTTSNSINVGSVTDAAPAAVYQSAREVVGVATQGVLTYTLPGWTPGVAALVRLHFAEIDPNMNGTYERHMTIRVQGVDRTEWEEYEVFVEAGALDKAIILETYCTPGMDGVITITLTGTNPHIIGIPGTWYYPTMINGIEVHQNSYAVRQLTSGGSGTLGWSGALKTQLPSGTHVMPLMFGRLELGDDRAITDMVDEFPDMLVREPVGVGDTGVSGSCPADDDAERPLTGDPGGGVSGTRTDSSYRWSVTNIGLENPNFALLPDQISWQLIMAEAEFPTAVAFFWTFVPAGQSTPQQDAYVKWASGSTELNSGSGEDSNVMSSGWWVLTAITP